MQRGAKMSNELPLYPHTQPIETCATCIETHQATDKYFDSILESDFDPQDTHCETCHKTIPQNHARPFRVDGDNVYSYHWGCEPR